MSREWDVAASETEADLVFRKSSKGWRLTKNRAGDVGAMFGDEQALKRFIVEHGSQSGRKPRVLVR